MKKFFSLICLILIFAVLVTSFGCQPDTWGASSFKDEQGLLYEPHQSGYGYVLRAKGDFAGTDLVIPSTFKGEPVVGIAKSAFLNGNLTSVSIPASVKNIGEQAFCACARLKTVTFAPDSQLDSIDAEAFYSCYSLTSISLPATLKSLGEYVFSNCIALTSVNIPSNSVLEVLSTGAFNACAGITSLNVPSTLKTIGASAFLNCTSLEFYKKGNGKYLGNDQNPCVWLMGVTMSTVTSLAIDDECQYIYPFALVGCNKLVNISIPSGIKTLDSKLFDSCSALSYNVYGAGNYIGNDDNPYLLLISLADDTATSINIHEDCEIINSYALKTGSSLTSVSIPASVRLIGKYAFMGTTSLTSVSMADTSGWSVAGVAVAESDLQNAQTRLQYLISRYMSIEWTKTE